MQIIKEPAYPELVANHSSGKIEDLTDELVVSISRRNGYLSPDQVRACLAKGETVYTEFSRYRRVAA